MPQAKIVILGSFNADIICRTGRMPLPGETIFGSQFAIGPGGKGSNQAVAARRAGGDVTLVAKLGSDVFADVALELYDRVGIPKDGLITDGISPTGTALILVDDATSQNSIIVYSGANFNITPDDVSRSAEFLKGAEIFLTQLENNLDATLAMIKAAKAAGARVVLNPAPASPLPDDIFPFIDLITPNETEAESYSGIPATSEGDIRRSAGWFLQKGVKSVAITLGSRGCFVASDEGELFMAAIDPGRPLIDTTGAGDCFAGALCTALGEGKSLVDACRFGSAAAALACTAAGAATSMPARDDIDTLLGSI